MPHSQVPQPALFLHLGSLGPTEGQVRFSCAACWAVGSRPITVPSYSDRACESGAQLPASGCVLGPQSPPSRIFVELLLRGVLRQGSPDSLPSKQEPPPTPPPLPPPTPLRQCSGGDVAGLPLFLSFHSCLVSL